MATDDVNITEDAEMAEYDGDKVVTMMDVLQEQQEFEEDVNAVLGASDDKNCTYSKGYIKRQALYACLTCCTEAKSDPTKRAGVCLACSLSCHENHELIELYTKRNFRCDCGNPKFNSHPCTFTPGKTDLNDENNYNQNFSGLYCICMRPYPDPESTFEDDMIQCIICEDWLHASHLETAVPANDQYSEMICKACMDKNEFLHDYSEFAVNVESADVDIINVNGDDASTETVTINGDAKSIETKTVNDDGKSAETRLCNGELEKDKLVNGDTENENDTGDADVSVSGDIEMDEDKEKNEGKEKTDTESDKNDEDISPENSKETKQDESSNIESTVSKPEDSEKAENVDNTEMDLDAESQKIEEEKPLQTINEKDNTGDVTEESNVEKDMEITKDTNEAQIEEKPITPEVTPEISEEASKLEAESEKSMIESQNNKIDTVEDKTDSMDDKKDSMDDKKDSIDDEKDIIDDKTDSIDSKKDSIDDEIGDKTDNIDNKTDIVDEKTNNTDDKTDILPEKMDETLKENAETQEQDTEQSTNKEKESDLATENVTNESEKQLLDDLNELAADNPTLEGKDITTKEKAVDDINQSDVKPTIEDKSMEKSSNEIANEINDSSEAKPASEGETASANLKVPDTSQSEQTSKEDINDKTDSVMDAIDELLEMANEAKDSETTADNKQTSELIDSNKNTENVESKDDVEMNSSEKLNDKVPESIEDVVTDTDKANADVEMGDSTSQNIPQINDDKDHNDSIVDSNKDAHSTETELNESSEPKGTVEENNVDKESVQDVGEKSKVTDTVNENISKEDEALNETEKEGNCTNIDEPSADDNNIPNVPENTSEHKRKLSTDSADVSTKKAKLDIGCARPKEVKRIHKGATFWPSNFRQKLCTCGECMTMYRDLNVLFLTDIEDTVFAYESLGKENSAGITSQYEKGLQALSSLDRIQQINALTEYNKMRDKLLDFLKSFKDKKEIVKEEDIKAFFAGMKPRREPDGVYFCR